MRAPAAHTEYNSEHNAEPERTVLGLDEGRDTPVERHRAVDDRLHGDREEVDAAQLRQVHREYDVEHVVLDRRELARVQRAKHL